MNNEKISIVVPCYNEKETLIEFNRRINKMTVSLPQHEFEFIYVNDGSIDTTHCILEKMANEDKRVKILHLARNRGHQNALTAGLDFATGGIIVTADADLQDPPEFIPEMIEKIKSGFDIVHAQRRKRNGETWFKLTSAGIFYRFLRWISETPIIENCGDFRAFTAPVLESFYGFRSNNRFLRGTFSQLGFRQCVIQYDRDQRYAGATKYSLFKMVDFSIDAILGFSAMPIKVITFFSLFLWFVSLVYLIKSLIEHFVLQITVPGWTSIIVLIIFFTGLILFSIAVIGSYIGRIYLQVQQPPLYWVAEARNIDPSFMRYRAEQLSEVRISERIINCRGELQSPDGQRKA